MSSYTFTDSLSDTFTIAHAKRIASKVATDLLRFKRFYGSPSDYWIDKFESELVVLLKYDAVDTVIYGFQRNNLWTMASAKYVALPGGSINVDDDPGKIRPGLDVSNAHFTSFLTYSSRWWSLTNAERSRIKNELPFQRESGYSSGLEAGYWAGDLNYVAGGRGLGRSTVRS
ncbi:MAG: hypothetical protein OXI88_07690 [Gammaproteobacteria bacterium]|nr:hypothetical protein [Gammaproteobacteria bacterium]